MRKPRALKRADVIAIVAPASGLSTDDLGSGIAELQSLGFAPRHEQSLFAHDTYTAGPPDVRAAALRQAWADPEVSAIIAARGGYGSVQLLPLLRPSDFGDPPKAFIGYSDNTSLMSWLTLTCGVVTFHGPMIEGRLGRGPSRYDRDSFLRCLTEAEPLGEVAAPQLETIRSGDASGMLLGGTMTQLAASLGTPYAFEPPPGCVLFLDEVGERPYRIHRLFTQLVQAGIIERAAALIFNELPRCAETSGSPMGRDAVVDLTRGFRGPVLFGMPSGHTDGATVTLPFGVRARALGGPRPSLVIEEAAVS